MKYKIIITPNYETKIEEFKGNNSLNSFKLKFDEWFSADLNGINKILAGANSNEYLTADSFFNNAINKGKTDGVF